MRRPVIGVLTISVLVAATLAFAVPAGGKKGSKTDPQVKRSTLFSTLLGHSEVSPTAKKGAGDPDARGTFTGLIVGDQFCFGITTTELATPTGAHVHRGKKGRSGPVVIPLTPPSAGDPGASSGCVSVDPALLDQLAQHPKRFYANVHTGEFPGGAIRGQLFHANPGQGR